jgi:hypothetical protein
VPFPKHLCHALALVSLSVLGAAFFCVSVFCVCFGFVALDFGCDISNTACVAKGQIIAKANVDSSDDS